MKEIEVFVSYSRKDAAIVRPLTQFLRAAMEGVFRDEDDVAPGDVWDRVIITSLEQAKLVYVMWCSHAQDSEWVQRETDLAIASEKRVVPVLLDKTPLPERLGKYQSIDFSERFKHTSLREEMGTATVACLQGLVAILSTATGCILPALVIVGLSFLMVNFSLESPGWQNPEIENPPLENSTQFVYSTAVLLFYAALFAAVGVGVILVGVAMRTLLVRQRHVRQIGKELAVAISRNSLSQVFTSGP